MTQISFLPTEKLRDFILLVGRNESNIFVCFQNILLKIIRFPFTHDLFKVRLCG